jgi:hypothetical protein
MKQFFSICLVAFLGITQLHAQAPVITKTTGFPIGANIPCYGIAYGASKYAAITNSGDVYTSTDGTTWTKSVSLGQTLNNIIFANSLFMVVGNTGYIATSADAITWTVRTSGTTNTLNDVQYLQSVFYAVGQNRTVLSSANGTTWSTVTVSVGTATDFLYQIAYGGGKYIISAGSTTGQGPMTYQSTTAASNSWSTVGGFGVFGNTNLNKMAFVNGKFVLITSGTKVFTSSDGAAWTDITATMGITFPNSTTGTVGNSNYFNTVYYDGTTYYWCGYSNYNGGAYGAIFTSTTLTALTLQSNPLNFIANKAYVLNGKHFIAGNEGLATSANGTIFSFPNGSFNAIAFNNTTYVGVGSISLNGDVFSSTTFNSNTWTNRSLASQKPLFGVVYDGSKFVAVGDRTVISSTDGNTWSSIATPAEVFACMAYGGSKYVVGGYATDYSSYFLKYSTNGTTWTTASTANVSFFKVRYLNGAFFALGLDNNYPASSGVIMRSADGITWTNVTPTGLGFDVYTYNDVTWDGTKYHFMGAAADYSFFTISTATPTTTTSYANKGTISNMPAGVIVGSSYGEGAIAYSNGKFVATAIDASTYEAYLVYSSNGTSWTTTTLTDKSTIGDIIVDNGKFRMVGTGDQKITVDFLSVLPVTLTNVKAYQQNVGIAVEWNTQSESGMLQYEVEKSADGTNFSKINTTAPKSGTSNTYNFFDQSPISGANYYRIKTISLNGEVTYSKIVVVKLNSKGASLEVYPNPFKGNSVQLQLSNWEKDSYSVTLFNQFGQQVLNRTINHIDGSGNQTVAVGTLAAGVYELRLSNGTTVITKKIIKE